MVERDNSIDDDTIIKGFSIAFLLPGPVAVNTVTYIGYTLRGWSGALISMIAVILPSMILIILLAIFYMQYNTQPKLQSFMLGVIPVVMALITKMAFTMGRKNLTTYKHYIVLGLVFSLQLVIHSYWSFLLSFILGGILGYFFFNTTDETLKNKQNPSLKYSSKRLIVIAFLILCLTLNFFPLSYASLLLEIGAIFSRVSLTLFGGGYVMIPMLNEILVVEKAWLSNTEFMDAISLGQITPGPILISATFIGYKMYGFWGAIVATIGIFLPSGLLMILISEMFAKIENNKVWKAIFEGLKPVVIALIISSILILSQSIDDWWISGVVFIISSILLLRFNINFLWLIGAAGITGILFL